MLFRKGNSKLGKNVGVWSLQAIKTCPGSSEACRAVCYATDNFFRMPTHTRLYQKNLRRSKSSKFVEEAVKEIHKKKLHILRIHVAGDFYDADYVEKWAQIVKQCPQTRFYAYTRSWVVPAIKPALRKLSKLPNMQLWLSFDKAMPVPRTAERVKLAYMSLDDQDWPPAKSNPDLVFRNNRKTVFKRDPVTDALVCPVENGVTHTTCDRCQVCFGKRLVFATKRLTLIKS